MTAVLTAAELATHLPHLAGWKGDVTSLERTVQAADFATAIRLVDSVALAAEVMNHHPDIDIRMRNVTFRCSTHAAGGVTGKDLALIEKINEIAAAITG